MEEVGNGGHRRSRGVNWTEEETEQLLEAWSDRSVQMLLENGPHNRQAFERVSFNLAQRQMDKTPSQCREKIKKLKTVYRNLNSRHGKVSRKLRGRLMQKLHQVMGGVTINVSQPEKGSGTQNPPESQQLDPMEDHRERPTATSSLLPDNFPAHFHALPRSTNGNFVADESSDSSNLTSSEDDTAELQPLPAPVSPANKHIKHHGKPMRYKANRSKRRSAIYVLIDKVIASQSAFNERFIALEEKRLQLDKEMQEKRIEAEAKRQEAQRQHELRLLSTMAQQMSCVLKGLNPSIYSRVPCETLAAPIAVAMPTDANSSKNHESVNGCEEYVHDGEAVVYSTI